DIDFAHQDREKVIQYVYQRYGREHAAMTAEVITYRTRSAIRDVGKALGLSLDEVDAVAKEYAASETLTDVIPSEGNRHVIPSDGNRHVIPSEGNRLVILSEATLSLAKGSAVEGAAVVRRGAVAPFDSGDREAVAFAQDDMTNPRDDMTHPSGRNGI